MVDDAEEMRRIIEDLVVELEDDIGLFVYLHSKNTEDVDPRSRFHKRRILEEGERDLLQMRGTMAKGRTGTERCSGVRQRSICSEMCSCSVWPVFGSMGVFGSRSVRSSCSCSSSQKKRHLFFLKGAFVR